jgi:hypothetical protein
VTQNAAYVITQALRLFGIIDQTEQPTAADLANNVPILNDLLRAEHMDGATMYLQTRTAVTLPPGVTGNIYSFSIGTANASYLVQVDAVAVKSIWMNDLNNNTNRETRMSPMADVVRTTQVGIITKWHQERQIDGSVLITAWQPPRVAAKALIDYGGRIPALTNTAGTDAVPLPPEGLHDAALLLGRRIMGSYGRVLSPTDPIIVDAEAANAKWKNWARGQQWLRMVRS